MDTDIKVDALTLRVALLEQILMRVWVSELATTGARNREDARQIALREVQEVASAIRGHTPSLKGAFAVFDDRVENLKTFIQTSR